MFSSGAHNPRNIQERLFIKSGASRSSSVVVHMKERGAVLLGSRVLPLRLDGVPIPGLSSATVRGTSIDRRMNALFLDMRAFVMRPFLAWTPNTDSSTR